jgi:hypothetical protein
MFNLETLLACKLLAKKQFKNIISTQLVIDDDKEKVYLLIEASTNKTLKDGTEQVKIYKHDITKMVKNHGGVEPLFKSLVVAEMMLAGYIMVPISGGFMCVGGDEVYSISDNECTCPAFTNNPSKPCKHLLYRDGLLELRARINKWKNINLK